MKLKIAGHVPRLRRSCVLVVGGINGIQILVFNAFFTKRWYCHTGRPRGQVVGNSPRQGRTIRSYYNVNILELTYCYKQTAHLVPTSAHPERAGLALQLTQHQGLLSFAAQCSIQHRGLKQSVYLSLKEFGSPPPISASRIS